MRRPAALRRKHAFAALGAAIATSAHAMRKRASDARDAASQAGPAVSTTLRNAIYVAAYYASYGVVVAALAVGRLAPSINPLADGVHDGAGAAREIGRNGTGRMQSAARRRVPKRSRTSVQ